MKLEGVAGDLGLIENQAISPRGSGTIEPDELPKFIIQRSISEPSKPPGKTSMPVANGPLSLAKAQALKVQSNTRRAPILAPWKQVVEDASFGSSQAANEPAIHDFSSRKGHTYNAVTTSSNSHIIQGDIVNVVNHMNSDLHASLFGIFTTKQLDSDDNEGALYRAGREQSELALLLASMPGAKYEPYADVNDSDVRQYLRKIAEGFQFLDYGFAEYFRVSIADSKVVRDNLESIRNAICQRQQPGKTWVGALGEFCEKITQLPDRQSVLFQSRDRGPKSLKYLQDALEVPYWNLIAEVFVKRSDDNDANKNSIQVVRSVVKDIRHEIEVQRKVIDNEYPGRVHDDIIKGINARTDVLDKFLEWTPKPLDAISKHRAQEFQYSRLQVLASVDPSDESSKTEPSSIQTRQRLGLDATESTDLEKISSFSLLILFFSAAFLPAAIGFSGYYKLGDSATDAIGSTADPDFYWLISSTLMAILGNLYSIIPLLKLTRGTGSYWMSWVFWFFSTGLGVLSVGTYPFLNKCWSSSFSLFCSLFAIASVYVSTLATGGLGTKNKVVADDDKQKTD